MHSNENARGNGKWPTRWGAGWKQPEGTVALPLRQSRAYFINHRNYQHYLFFFHSFFLLFRVFF